MFKKVEETISVLRKKIDDSMKKAQIKHLELKNTMSKIKIYWIGIKCRSDTAEESISEFKDMSIETVQNETQREKWLKNKSSEHHWAVDQHRQPPTCKYSPQRKGERIWNREKYLKK